MPTDELYELHSLIRNLWPTSGSKGYNPLREQIFGDTPQQVIDYEKKLYDECVRNIVPIQYIPKALVVGFVTFSGLTHLKDYAAKQTELLQKASRISPLGNLGRVVHNNKFNLAILVSIGYFFYNINPESGPGVVPCALVPAASASVFGENLRNHISARYPESKLMQEAYRIAQTPLGTMTEADPSRVAVLRYSKFQEAMLPREASEALRRERGEIPGATLAPQQSAPQYTPPLPTQQPIPTAPANDWSSFDEAPAVNVEDEGKYVDKEMASISAAHNVAVNRSRRNSKQALESDVDASAPINDVLASIFEEQPEPDSGRRGAAYRGGEQGNSDKKRLPSYEMRRLHREKVIHPEDDLR